MPARHDLARHLDKENLQPIYLLISTERLLLTEATSELRGRVLTAAPDFNRDEFSAADVPAQRAVDAAKTMPMMAPKRWVHFADIEKLKADAAGPLLAYLDQPSPTSVLCISGAKLDGRTKLGKQLGKKAAHFVMEPPRQNELGVWLERRAAKLRYAIEPEAACLLGDMVGIDIGALDRALDKLWCFIEGEGEISHADVEELVAPTRLRSIFDLVDAIGARELAEASLLIRNAVDGGENGLRVLAMITRQFRLLLRAKGVRSTNPSEIARQLGVAPFVARSLLDQARRYSEAELCRALEAAARADIRMKSTRLNHGVILDRLLIDAMGAAAA